MSLGGMGASLHGCMGVLGLGPFGILNHIGGCNGPGWHMSNLGCIQYGKKGHNINVLLEIKHKSTYCKHNKDEV